MLDHQHHEHHHHYERQENEPLHLIIQSGDPGVANLDLIVDDIDETRAVLEAEGASPTVIQRGNPHDRFIATDPEGNTLIVNSNHAIGEV